MSCRRVGTTLVAVANATRTARPWRKSSFSNGQGGDCVELRPEGRYVVWIRDSKNPGTSLNVPTRVFRTLRDAAKLGVSCR